MKKIVIIFSFFTLNATGFSQTEKLLVPSDLKQQTIVTEPVTLRKGFFRTGLLLNYRVADRFFNNSGTREYYNDITSGSKSAYGITLQYGFTDRLEIDLLSEYLNAFKAVQSTKIEASTNKSTTTVEKQKGLGIGDSHIALKYQIIQEKENKFSLTGMLNVTVPTGEKNPGNIRSENQYDLPVGDGTYALGLNISARKIAYPYSFAGHMAYSHNFYGTKVFINVGQINRKFRFGNLFETGLNGNLHLNEWIVFGNEINFYNEGQGEIENLTTAETLALMPASWAISYEPSLIFQVHRFRLGESVMIPLKGKNVPADLLYVLIGQYIF
jgi:hypothetical protein